jgi:hypothetical protein
LARPKGKAGPIGEILFAIVRAVFAVWAYSLFIKVCIWLNAQISGRNAKIVAGLCLGLVACFLVPVVAGLLGL